jgi:RNA polymerase sigma-70 factor (ECF subfamily)
MTATDRQDRGEGDAARRISELFIAHEDFIRTVVRFQAGDRFDEEDVVQSFYLMLLSRSLPPGIGHLRSYLYKAVTHHVADLARHGSRYRRHLKIYARQRRISINMRPTANAIEEKEQGTAAVAYMVRHLRDRQAEAFTLKYRDGYSIAEIAQRMGVNKRTVSRYLCDAVRTLREILQSNEGSAYEGT